MCICQSLQHCKVMCFDFLTFTLIYHCSCTSHCRRSDYMYQQLPTETNRNQHTRRKFSSAALQSSHKAEVTLSLVQSCKFAYNELVPMCMPLRECVCMCNFRHECVCMCLCMYLYVYVRMYDKKHRCGCMNRCNVCLYFLINRRQFV